MDKDFRKIMRMLGTSSPYTSVLVPYSQHVPHYFPGTDVPSAPADDPEAQPIALPEASTSTPPLGQWVLMDIPQEVYQAKEVSKLPAYLPNIVFQTMLGGYLSVWDASICGVAGLEDLLQVGKLPAFNELSSDKIGIIFQWFDSKFKHTQIRARNTSKNYTAGKIFYMVAEGTKKFLHDNGWREGEYKVIDLPGYPLLFVDQTNIYITGLKHVSKAAWQVKLKIAVLVPVESE